MRFGEQPFATDEIADSRHLPSKVALQTQIEAARPEGLEPSTYGLEIRCSIQLSYGRRTTNVYRVLRTNKRW